MHRIWTRGMVTTAVLTWLNAFPLRAQSGIRPTEAQIAWHKLEFVGFIHFGPNTFTNNEFGTGKEPVDTFWPDESKYDPDQWVRVMKAAGMKMVILVAKHHNGFCLFQTQFTDYSLKSSGWMGGRGDVVRDVSLACQRYGLKFGLYTSPADFNYPDSSRYNEYFSDQLVELLGGGYGPVTELWFDGNFAGTNFNGGEQYQAAKRLMPDIQVFGTPDVRWVGNETCDAPDSNWNERPLNTADSASPAAWIPLEADCSFHETWFHRSPAQPYGYDYLREKYFSTVGKGALYNLGIPPNRDGRIDAADSIDLTRFGKWLADTAFKYNLALGRPVIASEVRGGPAYRGENAVDTSWDTHWSVNSGRTAGTLEVDLGADMPVNMVVIQEYIRNGQYVERFQVEARVGGGWQPLVSGTTIGYKRILRFNDVVTDRVRLNITGSREAFHINNFAVYDQQARTPLAVASSPHRTGLGLEWMRQDVLEYSLPKSGRVILEILDVSGRRLAIPVDASRAAGTHRLAWKAPSPGVYLARLRFDREPAVQRIFSRP